MNRELLERYDRFFGKGSSNRLLEAQKSFLNNQFIRVNQSRSSIENISHFFKSNKVRFSKTFFDNSFKIEKSFFNLSSSLEAISGDFYFQDLASQIPVNCVDFDKLKRLSRKVRVLDMAASPGSKTTQIADLLEFEGIEYSIVALEPEKKRLLRLVNNIQKQGFSNIEVFNVRGEEFESNEKFDVIILDAPCSGNLVGDRNWLKRDLIGISQNSELQRKLMRRASKMLSENGILIYSTCSLEVEENEKNVLWASSELGLRSVSCRIAFGFETDSYKLIYDNRLKEAYKGLKSVRVMPYLSGTQGFFVCYFEKTEFLDKKIT